MTIFIMAISSAACTAAESTSGSWSVFLAVRHVAAAASETREVDASTTAGEGKSAPVGKHSVGEPGREVCTDQRCGKCSPGFSDTLGVQVRPVGVYVGNVVLL